MPAFSRAISWISSASSSVRLRGVPRRRPAFLARRITRQQASAKLVVVLFVGLYNISIERGGLAIACRFTELNEALVAYQRDAFASELTGCNTGGSALQRA